MNKPLIMERKIGEIFEYNGEWYQCVEQPEKYDKTVCNLCDFHGIGNCELDRCSGIYRSDKKNVIFKKLEKVGEPFERNGYMYQEYKTHTYPLLMSGGAKIPTPNGFAVIIKNKEDMKTTISKDVTEYSNFENTGKNLKPFDIEKAKAGHPVCTRDGRKARIICFDRIFYYEGYDYPIVAMVNNKGNESVHAYTKDGLLIGDKERDYDLMMASEKKTGWINIYPQININHMAETGDGVYPTEAVAKLYAQADCIATVPIEWEE